jgi:hypothetical protein
MFQGRKQTANGQVGQARRFSHVAQRGGLDRFSRFHRPGRKLPAHFGMAADEQFAGVAVAARDKGGNFIQRHHPTMSLKTNPSTVHL